MVSALVSCSMIILLLLSGKFVECVKRILMLIVNTFLKILNLFGLHINNSEHVLRTSHEFKELHKDIKTVKLSKENNKLKPSINIVAVVLLLLSIGIVVYNLDVVSGGFISVIIYNNCPIDGLFHSVEAVDTALTAILFSVISFSLSKIAHQWKETKPYRQARKEMKLQEHVVATLSSKALLDAAMKKDQEQYIEATYAHSSQGEKDV